MMIQIVRASLYCKNTKSVPSSSQGTSAFDSGSHSKQLGLHAKSQAAAGDSSSKWLMLREVGSDRAGTHVSRGTASLSAHSASCLCLYFLKRSRWELGEGNGTPLQYSCLENPMDGGAWWAAIYGVAQSRTRLKSMGSLRVGHDWATSLSLFTFMHWRRKWQPTPVFLLGESQGRGSLVGCRLWGRTESDTTEAT